MLLKRQVHLNDIVVWDMLVIKKGGIVTETENPGLILSEVFQRKMPSCHL